MIENTGAVDLVLTPSDLSALQDGLARITPKGDRYAPQHQRFIDR
jgi:hypothetical protein